jgi:hypothetical protein
MFLEVYLNELIGMLIAYVLVRRSTRVCAKATCVLKFDKTRSISGAQSKDSKRNNPFTFQMHDLPTRVQIKFQRNTQKHPSKLHQVFTEPSTRTPIFPFLTHTIRTVLMKVYSNFVVYLFPNAHPRIASPITAEVASRVTKKDINNRNKISIRITSYPRHSLLYFSSQPFQVSLQAPLSVCTPSQPTE